MTKPLRQNDLADGSPIHVSLVRLIADPERFRDRLVQVLGYLVFQFEGDAIFLHGDDALFRISANSLAVQVTPDMHGRKDSLGGYALLEGVFDPDMTGHRGAFPSGGLVHIRRCVKWPPDSSRGVQ